MGDDGIFLGVGDGGDVSTSAERSALVIGPSRSGKTTSLIIPNLLVTSRAVVSTSTKSDVISIVSARRRDVTSLLFDPSGETSLPSGVRRVGYSPLRASRDWDRAVLVTRTLVAAARDKVAAAHDHWTERATALVAPLLHAHAIRGSSLADVANAIDRRDGAGSFEELRDRYGDEHPAPTTLAGVLATEAREQSGIWSTAAGLFAGLRTTAARDASAAPPLDILSLLEGAHHLHIVAPRRHQAVVAALVVSLIDEVVDHAYRRHPDPPGLLLALDELANIAPVPDLAAIVTEGGGQGVLTLACLQDLSQARQRWGGLGESFVSLFPTTVVLPGVADRPTLDLIATLGGRQTVPGHTVQRTRRRRLRGHSTAWHERERLAAGDVAHGRAGFALTIGPHKAASWTRLVPYFEDSRFA